MTDEEVISLYESFKDDSGRWLTLHHQHFTQFVTIMLGVLAISVGAAFQVREDPPLLAFSAIGPLINLTLCVMAIRVCDRFYQRFLEHEAIAMKFFDRLALPPERSGRVGFFPNSTRFLPERWLISGEPYATISDFVAALLRRGVNGLIHRALLVVAILNLLTLIGILGLSLTTKAPLTHEPSEAAMTNLQPSSTPSLPQTPLLTVDLVLFSNDSLLLIKRAKDPFKDQYALPGGYVEIGESVEDACKREALEETSVHVSTLRLVGVYSDPNRDPRRHTVSVAFLGTADVSTLKAGDDARHAELVKDWRSKPLAFDHSQIVADAWRLHASKS